MSVQDSSEGPSTSRVPKSTSRSALSCFSKSLLRPLALHVPHTSSFQGLCPKNPMKTVTSAEICFSHSFYSLHNQQIVTELQEYTRFLLLSISCSNFLMGYLVLNFTSISLCILSTNLISVMHITYLFFLSVSCLLTLRYLLLCRSPFFGLSNIWIFLWVFHSHFSCVLSSKAFFTKNQRNAD